MKRCWQKLIKELERRNLLLAGLAVLLSLPIVLVAVLLAPRSLFEVCVSRGEPDPTSFEAVCGLTHDEIAALDETALLRWVQQKRGTALSEDDKTVWKDIVYYNWEDEGTEYAAALVDGHVQTISIGYQHAGPTFCQVVERLGPPTTIVTDWYRGVTGGNWYSIELEYPEQPAAHQAQYRSNKRGGDFSGILSAERSERYRGGRPVGFILREMNAECKFAQELNLDAIARAVPLHQIRAVLQEEGVHVARERKFNMVAVVLVVVAMSLYASSSIAHVLKRVAQGLRFIWPAVRCAATNRSA